MQFNFEKLEVWQLAMDLIDEIYETTKKYPNDEKYGLASQARRSVTSIALNISEGSIRCKKEFNQFIRIALGSLVETVTNLNSYPKKLHHKRRLRHIKVVEPLYFKLIKLSKSLKNSPSRIF